MATLTIRNVDAAAKERLRMRAARHGRSMEAELRAILNSALGSDEDHEPNLAESIRRRFGNWAVWNWNLIPRYRFANRRYCDAAGFNGCGLALIDPWTV
jgi:antitoxin FitA